MAIERIALNMVTIRAGRDPNLLEANLDRIRRAGFDGAGLWVDTVRGWLDAGRQADQLAGELAARGLSAEELCFVAVLDEQGGIANQREAFEQAAAIGAPTVICIYPKPDNPLPKVQADWAAFVEKVQGIGPSAAFEFIGPWPRYNSPLSAWQVVGAGPAGGAVLLDTFHYWRGGCDLAELDQVPPDRIALVHLNDAKDVPREQAKDSDRTYPGQGVIPLEEMLGKLVANGYAGAVSVEIFGDCQEGDPDEVARRAYESASALIAAL